MDESDMKAEGSNHWIIFNIPTETSELPEGIPNIGILENGGMHGTNDRGQIGYFGPCPPAGSSHEYEFRIFALDILLEIDSGASKATIERAMQGHILSETILSAKYNR
jgi:Raf kinase inhibitor-like YbhB/YbcL family protein